MASLILSLESVFAALAGWLLKGEALLPKELFGCVLVFAAVVIAQLPSWKKKAGIGLTERKKVDVKGYPCSDFHSCFRIRSGVFKKNHSNFVRMYWTF